MLKNLKIGPRLSFGLGIIMLLMMIVGGYSIKTINSLHDEIAQLVQDRMVKVEQANTIIGNINIVARSARNMIIDDNKDHQAEELSRIADQRKSAGVLLEQLNKTIRSEKGVAILGKLKVIRPIFSKNLETYLGLIKEGQTDQAKGLLLGEYKQIQSDYLSGPERL